LKPLQWKTGRVKQIHPGKHDNHVRVTTLESENTYKSLKNGKLQKITREIVCPIVKLAKLPIEETVDHTETKPRPYHKTNGGRAITTANRTKARMARSPWEWIVTLLTITSCLTEARAIHDPTPNLTRYFPECQSDWTNHYEIPSCVQSVQWIHLDQDGQPCVRRKTCRTDEMVSADTTRCDSYNGNHITNQQTCSSSKNMTLDEWQCQTTDDPSKEAYLRLPDVRLQYCSVDSYQLQDCQHFTEGITQVTVVIVNQRAYPLSQIHLHQDARTQLLSSYKCTDACKAFNCSNHECYGDVVFVNILAVDQAVNLTVSADTTV